MLLVSQPPSDFVLTRHGDSSLLPTQQAVLYGGAYLALYFEPGRSMVIEWKLNPSPPPKGSALVEAALSLRGLAIVAGSVT